MRSMLRLSAFVCGCLSIAQPAPAQILNLQDLNVEQIQKLDRSRTAVVIPAGILEEHGPYLPAFTDGYVNEYLARRVAESILAMPGWTVLMFPAIPLGDGGANQIGKKQVFPPTFHVHFSTLRAVYMDIAAELGESGFRWVFVISRHGAQRHQQALDQAGDFFTDTYNGKMVHLTGLVLTSQTRPNLSLTDAEQSQNGLDIHGGMSETSEMLFLHPELVAPGYQQARPLPGSDRRQLVDRAASAGWPGYFGAPALGEAWRGAALLDAQARDLSDLANQILNDLNYRPLPRKADQQLQDAAIKEHNDAGDAHARVIQGKQSSWLRGKGLQ